MKEIPRFKTELEELFSLLNTRSDSKMMRELIESSNRFKHISYDTAQIMKEFANIRLPRKNKEGDYNMCQAVIDIRKEGERIGEARGEKRGEKRGVKLGEKRLALAIKNLMENTQQSYEEACKLLGISGREKTRYKKLI